MSWKEHLNHLIADGEEATYLESREILEKLLDQSAEDRWKVILGRDKRLERLVPTDYQWLLKMTALPKASEITEKALSVESAHLGEQWRQYSEHFAKTMESSLEKWNERLERHTQDLVKKEETPQSLWDGLRRTLDFRVPLRLFLMALIMGVVMVSLPLNFDQRQEPLNMGAPLIQHNPREVVKIAESSQSDRNELLDAVMAQAQWNEILRHNSQDVTNVTKAVEAPQPAWFEPITPPADLRVPVWLFLLVLIPNVISSWEVIFEWFE